MVTISMLLLLLCCRFYRYPVTRRCLFIFRFIIFLWLLWRRGNLRMLLSSSSRFFRSLWSCRVFIFVLLVSLGSPALFNNITCYLEVNLLASELNSFLFDINTNLQAFACFSKGFRLKVRPQPSGHRTKSF